MISKNTLQSLLKIEGLIRSYAAITCSNVGESASKRLPVRRPIRDVDARTQALAMPTSTQPMPENSAMAASPGCSGNWRTNDPVMMMSPARKLRP